MQLANVRVGRKRPNNRMLSPARPNHKYAHVREPTPPPAPTAIRGERGADGVRHPRVDPDC